jgi:hypothetical protein
MELDSAVHSHDFECPILRVTRPPASPAPPRPARPCDTSDSTSSTPHSRSTRAAVREPPGRAAGLHAGARMLRTATTSDAAVYANGDDGRAYRRRVGGWAGWQPRGRADPYHEK